jgi:hypothetical protein
MALRRELDGIERGCDVKYPTAKVSNFNTKGVRTEGRGGFVNQTARLRRMVRAVASLPTSAASAGYPQPGFQAIFNESDNTCYVNLKPLSWPAPPLRRQFTSERRGCACCSLRPRTVQRGTIGVSVAVVVRAGGVVGRHYRRARRAARGAALTRERFQRRRDRLSVRSSPVLDFATESPLWLSKPRHQLGPPAHCVGFRIRSLAILSAPQNAAPDSELDPRR